MNENTVDLAALERLLSEATKTPWSWKKHPPKDRGFYSDDWRLAPGILVPEDYAGTPGGDEIDRANAALIVAAINSLPALLAIARQQEGLKAKIAHLEMCLEAARQREFQGQRDSEHGPYGVQF